MDAFPSPESLSQKFLTTLQLLLTEAASGQSARDVLETMLKRLVRGMAYHRVYLDLLDLPFNNQRLALSQGQDVFFDHLQGPGPLVTGQLLATKQPLTIDNLHDHPDFYGRPQHDLENLSMICVPVLDAHTSDPSQRQALGALCVDLAKAPPVFLERQRNFLEVVALALALVVMRLREEVTNPKPKPKPLEEALPEGHKPKVVAVSKSIRLVLRQIEQAAHTDAPVIIRGEEGTGKEFLAQTLHNQSHRRKKPFLSLACGSEPQDTLDKILFGMQKGQAANVSQSKRGLLELAQGGSLYLADIESLSPRAQMGLARFIQDGTAQRLGSETSQHWDVRIIAASHANLDDLMNTGAFQEDLYYALGLAPIHVPPLRERAGDILPLAEYFLREMAQTTGKPFKRISTPAIDLLNQYHWPDNVRELRSCMERAFEQCEEGVIRAYHLPPVLQTAESSNTESELSFGEAVDQFEKELLVEALKKAKGNMYQAAKDLRDSYRIINYKVKKHNIDPKRFTPGKKR